MKIVAAMLQQWHREDPARLLQAALLQAERLAQMAPELEALRAQNAWLHQQLEVQTKRLAQLETALQEAQRLAYRQAAPFRGDPQKRAMAPKRPGRKRGHPGACRPEPEQIDESLRSNSAPVHTAVVRSSRTTTRASSSLKIFHPSAPMSHG
jgi:multidrug resistance efflux pump